MENIYISKSKKNLYDKCPLAYKFKNVMGLTGDIPSAWTFGKNQHEFYNNFFELIFIDSRNEFVYSFIDKWRFENAASKNFIDFQKSRWESCLEKQKANPKKYFYPVMREEMIISRKKMLVGILDGLYRSEHDDMLEIAEYKTGVITPERLEKYTQELLFYKILFEDVYPEKIPRAFVFGPTCNKIERIDLTKYDVNKLLKEIEEVRANIMNEKFDPTPSFEKCEDCIFKENCQHYVQ